jgi:hypothetical protein
MANLAPKYLESTSSAFAGRRAVLHLFGEYERARAEMDAANARLNRFGETIQLLLAGLPELDRSELARKFDEIRSGVQARGGEAFNNVVALFKRDNRAEWTARSILSELEKAGAAAEPKAVSNAVMYLTKIGRLRRVGRGQYIVEASGAGIQIEGSNEGHWNTEHEMGNFD